MPVVSRWGEIKLAMDVYKTDKEVRAYRAVANILAKNRYSKIACHKVIKNDNIVGA